MKKKGLSLVMACVIMAAILPPMQAQAVSTSIAATIDPTINLQINDEQFIARDANGTAVFPVIINGSTYLPLRGVAAATGLDVSWDGASNTATLTTSAATVPAAGESSFTVPFVDYKGAKLSTINESEDNDDRYTPQIINLNQSISGTIGDLQMDKTDENDWYEVTVPSEGILWVQLTSSLYSNPEVYIIAKEASSSIAQNSADIYDERKIEIPVEKGTYLINIKNSDHEGNYTLNLGHVPVLTETEDNDTRETAYSLKDNARVSSWIGTKTQSGSTDDKDFYAFTIDSTQYVSINVVNEDTTNAELYLYSAAKSSSIQNDSAGIKTNRFIKTTLQAGTYYIEVKNSDDPGFYAVKYETVKPESVKSYQTTALVRPDINIMLNGSPFIAKDSGGNVIYPVLINGSTYLPVRSVAQAIDIFIGWDKSTRTVLMNRINPNNIPVAAGSLPTTADISESEDNDDRYTPNMMGINNTATGTIGDKQGAATDDSDWYMITIPNEGILKVTLSNDQATNSELYLFGIHNSSNSKSDSSGIQSTRTIEGGVLAGRYLIKVANSDAAGSYTLATSFESLAMQTEDNDHRSEACVIDLGTTITGYVDGFDAANTDDTNDFYKIYVFDTGTLNIELSNAESVNAELYLYSASAASNIMQDSNGIKAARNINTAIQPGVYYIEVKNADHEGSYDLHVNLVK